MGHFGTRAWMEGQMPDTRVFMEEEMTGLDMPIIISVGNANFQKLMKTVSLFEIVFKARLFKFSNGCPHPLDNSRFLDKNKKIIFSKKYFRTLK